jgi:CHAT domain-containing protein
MRVEVPEVASLVSPEPCNLSQVQNLILDENTALIEYFLGESKSFVFLITKKNRYLFELPKRNEIRKSLRAYLKALSDQPRSVFKGLKASERISKKLLPFMHLIPDIVVNLVIVPDDTLYYLPFETLSHSDNANPYIDNLLVSKFDISYSPSSSSLLFLTRQKRQAIPPKDLLAFGDPVYMNKGNFLTERKTTPSLILKGLFHNEGFDLSPLPYSKREIVNISRFFDKKNKDIFTGDKASETNFKSISIDNYKIIHFACHGLLDEKIPLRSALVLSLSKDGNEDGFLQVSEIYNLRLNSELVILSACQTARGRLENGEGVLGLPRIFFYSGARSVISTLWRIEDKSTAKFMRFFYKFLNKGFDKSKSLRLAKIQMIKSGYTHPFYWAGFILNGDYASSVF